MKRSPSASQTFGDFGTKDNGAPPEVGMHVMFRLISEFNDDDILNEAGKNRRASLASATDGVADDVEEKTGPGEGGEFKDQAKVEQVQLEMETQARQQQAGPAGTSGPPAQPTQQSQNTWTKEYDVRSGHFYYINTTSGQSAWQLPPGGTVVDKQAQQQRQQQQQQQQQQMLQQQQQQMPRQQQGMAAAAQVDVDVRRRQEVARQQQMQFQQRQQQQMQQAMQQQQMLQARQQQWQQQYQMQQRQMR